jgi:thiol-disulfide isomerase/thioredoxin
VNVLFFSSSFCAPCAATRAVLSDAAALVPGMTVIERDVVRFEGEAEKFGIRSTPTVVIVNGDDVEVFRAEGIPSVNQVLVAAAKAL